MILSSILKNASRHEGGHPRDPALAEYFGPMQNTASGQTVTAATAMRVSAVHACVRVIAETLAGLPLILYRRVDDGKERAYDNALYDLLHDTPNPWQTAFEFREMLQAHVLLTGAGYAEIVRNRGGEIQLLRPLHPRRVRPFRFRDSIAYSYTELDGTERVIFTGEMFVIRNMMSDDGITPLSMIDIARESMGLAMATEEHGAKLFSNDATPSGILVHPGKLDNEAVKRLRTSWEDSHRGSSNAYKTAVLEGGLEYKSISISPKDSQFIEARKFQVVDIARIYLVPPHKIGELEKSAFSNIEQQSLDFIASTMRSWFVRWEQAILRDIILPRDRKTLFVEFLVDALLRGDVKSRYDAYSKALADGWLNRNGVRVIEGLNKVDGLDEYLVPLNMAEAGTDDAIAARATSILQAAEARVARKEKVLIDKHGPEALQDERHVHFVMDVLALSETEAKKRIDGVLNEN